MTNNPKFGGIEVDLTALTVSYRSETRPVAGAVGTVHTEDTRSSRVTVTRLFLFGLFAFGARRQDGCKTIYITISGPEFEWLTIIPGASEANARLWVAMFNDLAKKSATST